MHVEVLMPQCLSAVSPSRSGTHQYDWCYKGKVKNVGRGEEEDLNKADGT